MVKHTQTIRQQQLGAKRLRKNYYFVWAAQTQSLKQPNES